MAVNETTDQGYTLPCGRELEQVWERLDEVEAGHADPHEADCPHCRAARESLLALRAATRQMIDEPEPPPPDLVGRIMSAVRAETRRGRTLDLATPHPGAVEVSEQAVAAILRYAADSVPGVRARRCRVRATDPGMAGERGVDVEMTVVIGRSAGSIGELLQQVRARLTVALPERIGVSLHRLDVHVGDLYQDRPDTEPGAPR
ncbi:Asp23/Gls24 family envelope stress response protein [Nocardia sp. NBC_01329]|uniref:Asp23/Gls24 family envelope stress response protein n=1 Tax=Nocardia sp. NBC_01329 TaxID=2903594 RepID=UPI002E14CF00|nr:Asp23/Gls24 family envelope stress response protein [Nocardia sp. NBC_01329]